MTAPMIPAAEPSYTVSDQDSALEAVVGSTLHQSTPEDERQQSDRSRNDKGQFTTQAETPVVELVDGQPVSTDAQPVVEGEPVVDDAPVIPEGFVAAKPLAEDKAKAFSVFDTDGEIVAPDLTWKLTANGKTRELSTDKLVNFAQMGVYNHEREVQHEQTQRHAQDLTGQISQYREAVEARDQQIERLLSDPGYLAACLTNYDQQNTPEARAQRDRDKLEHDRRSFEFSQIQNQAATFVDGPLTNASNKIIEMFPTVSQDELAAKLYLYCEPLRVNGVLHPQHFQRVANYVVTDLYPWAEQLNEHRRHERSAASKDAETAKADADKKVKAAQVAAQKAKNQTARTVRPAGRGTPGGGAPPPKPIRTTQDAEAAVIDRTLSFMRSGG